MLAAGAMLVTLGLTGCQTTVPPSVRIDKETRLFVSVEGIRESTTPLVPSSTEGEPIHRTLQNGDGRILFAYDLEVSKTDTADAYRFLLKPADDGPTFDASREVTVSTHDDSVRVELMEEPGTGRKVEDVYRLLKGRPWGPHDSMFQQHVYMVHSFFRRLLDGE